MVRFSLFFVGYACLLLLTGGTAQAQAHIAYCDEAESTAALQNCVKQHHDSVQDRLKKVYENFSAELDTDGVNRLRELQAQWLEYRDAECGWEAIRTEKDGLRKIYELSCIARMTENRAMLLEASLRNQDTLEQAELSGFPRWMNAMSKDFPDVFWRFGERERIDLNCEGNEEVVMIGAAISRINIVYTDDIAMDKDLPGRLPYAMDVVVAITENPTVGRPRTQLFRLPIGTDMEGPNLCSEKVGLALISTPLPQKKPQQLEEGQQNQEVKTESLKFCGSRVRIESQGCPYVDLYWTGKDYALETEQDRQVLQQPKDGAAFDGNHAPEGSNL